MFSLVKAAAALAAAAILSASEPDSEEAAALAEEAEAVALLADAVALLADAVAEFPELTADSAAPVSAVSAAVLAVRVCACMLSSSALVAPFVRFTFIPPAFLVTLTSVLATLPYCLCVFYQKVVYRICCQLSSLHRQHTLLN